MSYRSDFVRAFGELFASEGARENYEGHGVERMELDDENEVVTVYYLGGGKRLVNVHADSLSAIAYDIIRYAL